MNSWGQKNWAQITVLTLWMLGWLVNILYGDGYVRCVCMFDFIFIVCTDFLICLLWERPIDSIVFIHTSVKFSFNNSWCRSLDLLTKTNYFRYHTQCVAVNDNGTLVTWKLNQPSVWFPKWIISLNFSHNLKWKCNHLKTNMKN